MSADDHEEISKPRPKPRQMLDRAFWFGYVTSIAISGAYQDWIGKAEFLRIAEENWLPTRWWMWAALLVWMCWEHYAQKQQVSEY